MRLFLLCALATSFMICGIAPRSLSQDANTGAASALGPVSYPDSPEGLQRLVEDIFAAIKSGDSAKASASLSGLVMPDHKAWFANVFGSDEGARMDEKYVEDLPQEPAVIRKAFEYPLTDGRTNVRVTVLQKTTEPPSGLSHALIEAMAQPISLYSVDGTNSTNKYPASVGMFAYVDGGFRYLNRDVLEALSTAPPTRIRIGGNVLKAQIDHKVSPIYPEEARTAKIEGTIVLHVVIGTDGAVKEAEYVSGDQVLAQAAIDAVRQWRYRPTTLNSKAVEVDSIVNVEFRLR